MSRVVTLLPAATEIVAALGDASLLVGISHECDYPPEVQHLPRVTTTPIDIAASSRVIDAQVHSLRQSGRAVISVDARQIRELSPDLIITQALCDVCAVSDGVVHQLASVLSPAPRVLSLSARNLAGIWADIRAVGVAIDSNDEAEALVSGLQSRLAGLRSPATDRPRARVLCIEWLDPLYLAGHWVPELVAAAGGQDVGAEAGSHSTRRSWEELFQLHPDYLIVMLCGFGIERARAELDRLENHAALELLHRVSTWIIDGNAYTSRPGPRIVDGAACLHSALLGEPLPGIQRWEPSGSLSAPVPSVA
jgi:iron complex transport system substrate-binding protein